ncbi:MAG: DNA gyrase C-terminal beta-propeller domain-containing protein, partial [Cyanobacteria bacterium J06607_17]
KRFLEVFLDFRVETITRRTQYELRKAEERDHILQGYLIALDNLDAVIALIRHAADVATAKQELMESYELSSVQADAILQMQLRRLTALEADKIQLEHETLQEKIADLRDILARRERILAIIEDELQQIRTTHANERRTVIEAAEDELTDISLIANEQVVILVTEQGYIKRMPVSTFEAQNRATRGKSGTRMKDDDAINHFITCCTHDHVLFFTDRGVAYALRAYQIPEGSRVSRGNPIVQMLPIPREEKVTSVLGVPEFSEDVYLVMLTQGGFIKKTALSAFGNIRANGLIAISLEDGDQLRWVRLTRTEDSIIIGSHHGMTIHFRADNTQLRPLGRPTRGVRSMSLRDGDRLISMDILPAAVTDKVAASDVADDAEDVDDVEGTVDEADSGPWVLVIAAGGLGKRVQVENFRLQNRAGMGLVGMKFRKENDELVALRVVNPGDELMLVTQRGIIIRQAIDAISIQSRMATGVQLQRLDGDDAIAAVAVVPELEIDEAAAATDEAVANEADSTDGAMASAEGVAAGEPQESEDTNPENGSADGNEPTASE